MEKDENNVIRIIRKDIASITNENRKEILNKIKDYFVTFSSEYFNRHFIFVYGSLRKGQENYKKLQEIYGKNSIQYIYTTKWDHRCIYDLGPYPAMTEGLNLDSVVGDVIFVENEVFDFIKQMEEEAGYKKEMTVLWLETDTSAYYRCMRIPAYVADSNLLAQIKGDQVKYPKIISGDWCRYQRETEPIESLVIETESERNNRVMKMWGDKYPYY